MLYPVVFANGTCTIDPAVCPSGSVQITIPSTGFTNGAITLTVSGNNGQLLAPITLNLSNGAAPTASISASPNPVISGDSSIISWTCGGGATAGSVSPTGWTGLSGSNSTGVLTSGQTYTVTCSGGTVPTPATDSVTVTVTSAPPTVTLTANPTTGAPPLTSTLTWTVSGGATSCTKGNGWTGTMTGANITDGSHNEIKTGITTGTNYTLYCTNAGGNSNTAIANVTPTGTISVSLSASPAGPLTAPGATTLTWTTTGSPTSCDATGVDWSGANILNGSAVTQRSGMPAKIYNFGIICYKAGIPNTSDNVEVVVNSAGALPNASIECQNGTGDVLSICQVNQGQTIRFVNKSTP